MASAEPPPPTTATSGSAARSHRPLIAAVVVLVVGIVLLGMLAREFLSNSRRESRQAFNATAQNVSTTLTTLLHRDADFLTTMRGVVMLAPAMTDSQFTRWYAAVDGRGVQVGGLGTAVLAPVPAAERQPSRPSATPTRRTGDPLDSRSRSGRDTATVCACVRLITTILPLDGTTSGYAQSDWCDRSTVVGRDEQPALRTATDTGRLVVLAGYPTYVPLLNMATAVYRPGAPLHTVAQRRTAIVDWVVGTFDATGMITESIGSNHRLAVSLQHRNPGQPWSQVAAAGSGIAGGALRRTTSLGIGGDWRVLIRGAGRRPCPRSRSSCSARPRSPSRSSAGCFCSSAARASGPLGWSRRRPANCATRHFTTHSRDCRTGCSRSTGRTRCSRGHDALGPRWPRCTSTSTASRPSTTRSGTPPATRCSSGLQHGCAPRRVRRTPPRACRAMNSSCSSTATVSTVAPSGSPSVCLLSPASGASSRRFRAGSYRSRSASGSRTASTRRRRSSSPRPMSGSTWPRRPARTATWCSSPGWRQRPRTGSGSRWISRTRSSSGSCSSPTSRRSISAPIGSSASRRCCAGATRSAVCCSLSGSSRSPRRAG